MSLPNVRRRRFGADRRILLKRDFDAVFQRPDMRLAVPPLWLAARSTPTEAPRLGLVVSRKVLRRAVDRNRAKRAIRESFRQTEGLPCWDIVVRVVVPSEVMAADADKLFSALKSKLARRRRIGDG